MTKHQPVQAARSQRRIFPNDYTRADLVEYATKLGAETYAQAEQIAALKQRVRELECALREPANVVPQAMRVRARELRGTCRR